MMQLFVAAEETKPTSRVFYIAANDESEAATLAEVYALKHEVTWKYLLPLPSLRPETLNVSPGQIMEWRVGESIIRQPPNPHK